MGGTTVGTQAPARRPPAQAPAPEVSIVMPCLNEADTLEICIARAQKALDEAGIAGEVIVADNGSTDGSPEIAHRMGARVVAAQRRGYGHALQAGIASARGEFVVMGDADASYDFGEVPNLVKRLREGFDLVQGCRLPAGGGTVEKGAMPFLHRWIGNPVLTRLVRRMFKAPVNDVYSGLRAFRKDHYLRLNQSSPGMEFAPEMIIKSSLHGGRIAEVPITLHPDRRRSHAPHLNTFRDGFRTLGFYLTYSPRWLFLIPGSLLVGLGLLGYALALPRATVMGATLDAHTLLFASLSILCGYQAILFAMFAKTFAINEGLLPPDPRAQGLFQLATLKRGLIVSLTALLAGLVLLLGAVNQWRLADFGDLDYSETMRWVIPGVTLTAIGFQTLLGSFFVSILRLPRR